MEALSNYFPFTRIPQQRKAEIQAFLGGDPITPETVRPFFKYYGLPMLPVLPHQLIVQQFADKVSDTFSDVPETQSRLSFQRGALLYAGVLAIASEVKTVPITSHSKNTLEHSSAYTISWDSYEKIQNEVPDFCKLMNAIKPGLETDNDSSLHTLAVMGAGLIHLFVTQYAHIQTEAQDFELGHPELADLKALFDTLPDD